MGCPFYFLFLSLGALKQTSQHCSATHIRATQQIILISLGVRTWTSFRGMGLLEIDGIEIR